MKCWRDDHKAAVLLTLHHWRVVLEEELVEVLVNEGTEAGTSQCCMRSHDTVPLSHDRRPHTLNLIVHTFIVEIES